VQDTTQFTTGMTPADIFREIRRIEIFTKRLVNEQLAGQYHSVFKGRGMAFEEVRQYQWGDDVRLIDWNVSARMNDVFVKLFVEEREMTVMLLVDVSASESFGTVRQNKAQLLARVAATLAFSAIKNNDRVGLIMFTDRVELFVPPQKGRKHVLRVVSEILRFSPKRRHTSISAGLDYLGRITRKKAVVFLLSDFIDSGWERAVRLASAKHDLVPVCVTDPREEELPDMGIVNVQDPETGEMMMVDTSSKSVRESYRKSVAQTKSERERLFRRLHMDFINMSTAAPDLEPLVRFFELRLRRARRY